MDQREILVGTMKPRKIITLTPELASRVDDYRFERRFKTETEALVTLIEAGLKAESKAPTDAGA